LRVLVEGEALGMAEITWKSEKSVAGSTTTEDTRVSGEVYRRVMSRTAAKPGGCSVNIPKVKKRTCQDRRSREPSGRPAGIRQNRDIHANTLLCGLVPVSEHQRDNYKRSPISYRKRQWVNGQHIERVLVL
jgi:hypothetical protein